MAPTNHSKWLTLQRAPQPGSSGFAIETVKEVQLITNQFSAEFGGHSDGQGFAAFGRVISGMDVVRRIQNAPSSNDRTTNTEAQRLTPPIKIVKAARLP